MTKRTGTESGNNNISDLTTTSRSSENKETGSGNIELAQTVNDDIVIGELAIKSPTQIEIRNEIKKKMNETYRQIKTMTMLDKSDVQGSVDIYDMALNFYLVFICLLNIVLNPNGPSLAFISDGRAGNSLKDKLSKFPRVSDFVLKSITPTVQPPPISVSTKMAIVEVHPTILETDSFIATILYNPTSCNSVGLTMALSFSNVHGLPDLHITTGGFPMCVFQKMQVDGISIVSRIDIAQAFTLYCDPALAGIPHFIMEFTKKMVKTELPQTSTMNAYSIYRFA